MKEKLKKGFTALFTNDKFITAIILLNSVVIFLQESGLNTRAIAVIDLICTLLFIIEMAVKQSALGLRGYWKDGWNRLDGTLVILSLPSIIAFFVPSQAVLGELSVLLVLRMLRILRFLRIIHIFPNFSVILRNFRKALKDSGGVFVGFFILIIIIALISCELFHSVSPEYFGTPIDSIYTIFRICTGRGVERDSGRYCRQLHRTDRALGTPLFQYFVGSVQRHWPFACQFYLCRCHGE